MGGVIADRKKLLVATPEQFRDRFNIEVRTGREVTEINRDAKTVEVKNLMTGAVSTEAYDAVRIVPVKRLLRRGGNHLAIRATAIRGPSAVAVELRSGDNTLIESNATWKGARSFGQVVSLTLEDGTPDEISALDEYNQWTESKKEHRDEAFSPLPDGFRLERLHRAPPDQGSWVSMTFDPKGDLIVAREKRG